MGHCEDEIAGEQEPSSFESLASEGSEDGPDAIIGKLADSLRANQF